MRINRGPGRFRLTCIVAIVSIMLPLWAAAATAEKMAIDLSNTFVQIAKKAIPAVVHIEVTARQEVANPFLPFENDPFFRYFFDTPDNSKKFRRDVKGIGTGMLIDAKGNILTNYHVAGGATKIEVVLADGDKYAAKLVGSDPKTDLAVVRIDAKKQLPFVSFGDSDRIEVGEWVIAIGHPRGLDQTVTHGIISAKHRRGITDPSSYQDFLQTDAAINPGNSGGPLLNLKGEVIGVNTVIVSSSGGFEGIGLSIPSNIAVHVAKTIISHGRVERGWLGVSAQDLTAALAKGLGINNIKGALVADVAKGSPAEKAGIRKDDVITNFNGKQITDSNMLRNEVAVTPIGKDVKVTIQRGTKTQELTVKMGDLRTATASMGASVKQKLGAEVRAATPTETNKYRLDEGQGIVITKVEQDGPFAKAGFEVNDMILEINGQAVTGLDTFAELVSLLKKGQRITLLALDSRTGRTGYLQVTVR
ncbi:MAG TPA: Do family serine endopeptidase [Syntrophorhabdaceae bacterium]|nr:Do family serine endopeptidase [Syntrophorhabdaceae bacterium]